MGHRRSSIRRTPKQKRSIRELNERRGIKSDKIVFASFPPLEVKHESNLLNLLTRVFLPDDLKSELDSPSFHEKPSLFFFFLIIQKVIEKQ
jgi:hypothetical protein